MSTIVDGHSGVKAEMAIPCVLATYNLMAMYKLMDPNKVSADASLHGLGAVLLQQISQGWRTAAYASRSMTDTETRYAQIEKEAQVLTWACEKLSPYILGMTVQL